MSIVQRIRSILCCAFSSGLAGKLHIPATYVILRSPIMYLKHHHLASTLLIHEQDWRTSVALVMELTGNIKSTFRGCIIASW